MSVVYGGLDLGADPYLLTATSDFGTPNPITATIPNLTLDGSTITGRRTDNRMLRLEVEVKATTRLAFAQAEANLALAVDAANNTLIVTPVGGLPVAYDTFRGKITPQYDAHTEASFLRMYVLEIPADPFARDVNLTSLSGTPTTTLFNAFDATSGFTLALGEAGDSSAYDTSYKTQGTGSLHVTGNAANYQTSFTVTGTSTIDCSTSRFVYLDVSATLRALSGDTVAVTLTLSNGAMGTVSITQTGYSGTAGFTWGTGHFNTFMWDLSAFNATPANRTGCSWTLYVKSLRGSLTPPPADVWIDNFRGVTLGGATTSASAGVGTMTVPGSYRTEAQFTIAPLSGRTLGDILVHRISNMPTGYDPTGPSAAYPAATMQGTFQIFYYVTNSGAALTSNGGTTITTTITQNGHSQTQNAYVSYVEQGALGAGGPVPAVGKSGNRFLCVGSVSLPLFDVDPSSGAQITVSTTFGGNLTAVAGPFLLRTDGETVACAVPSTDNLYITALPSDIMSRVSSGSSLAGATGIYPPPLGDNVMHLDAGLNAFFVYTASGTSGVSITASGYTRWLTERPG